MDDALVFFVAVFSYAQKATISGNVSDINGPLVGANVLVVGTTVGATTDSDGNYSFTIDAGTANVSVSYIGYDTQTQQVDLSAGQALTLDFLMISGAVFEDVVVTGTRSKPRTAIQSPVPIDNFKSEELERQGNGDLTETLKNLVPSFTATPLTGDGSAFIRPFAWFATR